MAELCKSFVFIITNPGRAYKSITPTVDRATVKLIFNTLKTIILEVILSHKRCNFKSFTFLSEKSRKKNFPSTTPIYLGKVFEIPKDFLQKVLWSGFGAEAPTDNAPKKVRQCRAFFIIKTCWNCRSKPCFKVLLKKRLKNPQNFCPEHTTSFWQNF